MKILKKPDNTELAIPTSLSTSLLNNYIRSQQSGKLFITFQCVRQDLEFVLLTNQIGLQQTMGGSPDELSEELVT